MCQQTDCKTQLPGTTVRTNKWCDLKSNKCKIYLARASTLQLNFIVCRRSEDICQPKPLILHNLEIKIKTDSMISLL